MPSAASSSLGSQKTFAAQRPMVGRQPKPGIGRGDPVDGSADKAPFGCVCTKVCFRRNPHWERCGKPKERRQQSGQSSDCLPDPVQMKVGTHEELPPTIASFRTREEGLKARISECAYKQLGAAQLQGLEGISYRDGFVGPLGASSTLPRLVVVLSTR